MSRQCPICKVAVASLTLHNKTVHAASVHGLVHEASSTDCEFCGRHFTGMMDHNMHNMQHGRLSGNLCVGRGCAVTFKRVSNKGSTHTVVTHTNNVGGDPRVLSLTNTPYGEPSIDELRSFCDSCHVQDMQTQYAQAWYKELNITPGTLTPGTIFPMAAGEDLKWVPAPVPQAVAPDQPLPSTLWPLSSQSWGGSPNYAPQPQWGYPPTPLAPGQWGPSPLMPGSGYVPAVEPEPVKPKPKKKEHPKPTVKRRLIDLDL